MDNLPGYQTPTEHTKDLELARYTELLKEHVSARLRDEAARKLQAETEDHLFRDLHLKLRETAKERAKQGQALAELVQKAAGAIVTLYTGLLALVFAADGATLPGRGLIPALFLGLSILLSTAYVAFLDEPNESLFQARTSKRESAWAQTRGLIGWVNSATFQRAHFLRASVVALGLGVAFLPLPFISGDIFGSGQVQAVDPIVTAAASPDASRSAVPDWPSPGPDANPSAAAAYEQILFQARVDEVAAARAAAQANAGETDNADVGLGALPSIASVAGIVLILLTLLWPVGLSVPSRIKRAVNRDRSAPRN